jgi:predicted GH43/DUF377 family glycosyl hydrolase
MPTLFQKSPTPVLAPTPDSSWSSGALFNPGACGEDGRVHLLFRAIPAGYDRVDYEGEDAYEGDFGFEDYVSYIGYATSTDGLHFDRHPEPFIRPDRPFDRFGVEDPRITTLDGRCYITYTALSAPAFGTEDGVRIALASTDDFETVEKHGVIGPPMRDKDAVLFPRRIGGRIAMLHRIAPDIQLVWFDDVDELLDPPAALWQDHLATLDEHVILRPARTWEAKKIGAGPPPIETDEGWLLVYHGVDHDHVYRAGLALLDLDDPRRVIARTQRPVLEPEFDFEREGDVDNVVFPSGAVVLDGTLHLYYGAADRVIGHAEALLHDVMASLREPEQRAGLLHRVYLTSLGRSWNPGNDGVAQGRSIATPPPVHPERLHGGQPVLEPEPEHDWESRVVLNPAAVLVEQGPALDAMMQTWALDESEQVRLREAGGACVMLYRAQGVSRNGHAPSALGLAVFTPTLDLVHRRLEPVLRPEAPFHNLGVEDPRCTQIGETYYLYYTGYFTPSDGRGGRTQICLATTQDFVDWTLCGPVEGDLNAVNNKNAALFPEPVDGRYLLLHRPMEGPRPMAIYWAEAERPEGPWTSRGLLAASYRYQDFALSWIGAAGPPVALGGGRFLALYHQGHFTFEGTREYDLAAMLLDANDRERPVQSRIEPLMRPTGALEQVGDPELGVDNVVFSCANYRWGDDLIVPYAAADSRIFGARISLAALVSALEEERTASSRPASAGAARTR